MKTHERFLLFALLFSINGTVKMEAARLTHSALSGMVAVFMELVALAFFALFFWALLRKSP